MTILEIQKALDQYIRAPKTAPTTLGRTASQCTEKCLDFSRFGYYFFDNSVERQAIIENKTESREKIKTFVYSGLKTLLSK